MSDHALCGASSAERWLNCPGSHFLQDGIPDTPSKYAQEGTNAHARAELLLLEWVKTKKRPEIESEAMQVYVDECIKEAEALEAEGKEPPAIRIEQRLTLHKEIPMFGTADFLATSNIGKAVICDLKWGKGLPVPPNSAQLAYYAVALWKTSKKELSEIKVKVIQPRYSVVSERIGEKVYTKPELEAWYDTLLAGAYESLFWLNMCHQQARLPNPLVPPLKAGKWCQFCRAKPICSAHQEWKKTFLTSAKDDFSPLS